MCRLSTSSMSSTWTMVSQSASLLCVDFVWVLFSHFLPGCPEVEMSVNMCVSFPSWATGTKKAGGFREVIALMNWRIHVAIEPSINTVKPSGEGCFLFDIATSLYFTSVLWNAMTWQYWTRRHTKTKLWWHLICQTRVFRCLYANLLLQMIS